MLGPWLAGERALDVDRARQVYHDLLPSLETGSQLTPEEEGDILSLIEDARRALAE
jgi:hypothetical protein